jgi:hypothetical protein
MEMSQGVERLMLQLLTGVERYRCHSSASRFEGEYYARDRNLKAGEDIAVDR